MTARFEASSTAAQHGRHPLPSTTPRVNEIDLLRFLAALAVVFFHYSFRGYATDSLSPMKYASLAPIAMYGYLGVDLFFMISGFVILMTAQHGCLLKFARSRFLRLYPAFWVCCTITFILTVAYNNPKFDASVHQYLVNMTMLNGFLGVPAIDGVYWSLYIELQFYAMVAMALLLGQITRAEALLFAWLVASAVSALAQVAALRFLLIGEYSALFIGGATCYLIWQRGWRIGSTILLLGSWLLASMMAIGRLRAFEDTYGVHMSAGVVFAITTAFFSVLALVASRKSSVVGRTRWVAVGALTYPLYLIHQKVGFMVFDAAHSLVNQNLLFWATVVGAMSLAYGVHVYAEKPLSKWLEKRLQLKC